MWVWFPTICVASSSYTLCITDRVQKLKEARTQATKEIEEYRKFKEEEFRAFEASVRRATPPVSLSWFV